MSSSTSSISLYVRMVDGVSCFAPVPAKANSDGTFHLLDNDLYDSADSSTLLEFIPGDDVKAELQTFGVERHRALLAMKLVQSTVADRDYWAVLFSVAEREGSPQLTEERLNAVAARVRNEIDTKQQWHYPTVVDWARARGDRGQSGA